ncbi:MAG: hypothetical protein JSW27_23955 [Phycisphaerales bacterium]|nr:MAG: hypothetical protein JSW27_23955 [Phycisphaerales bacterium]
MSDRRFSWEEFESLFPGPFASEQEKQKEYEAFLLVLEQLDRVPVPELSMRERAEIFRRSWPQSAPSQPSVWASLTFFRRPAVTFALGLALGCAVMFAWTSAGREPLQAAAAEPPFTLERTGDAQTYSGTVVQELYPQIENPKLVVEKTPESSQPQRVLHGTLDNGKIQVLWNL